MVKSGRNLGSGRLWGLRGSTAALTFSRNPLKDMVSAGRIRTCDPCLKSSPKLKRFNNLHDPPSPSTTPQNHADTWKRLVMVSERRLNAVLKQYVSTSRASTPATDVTEGP